MKVVLVRMMEAVIGSGLGMSCESSTSGLHSGSRDRQWVENQNTSALSIIV